MRKWVLAGLGLLALGAMLGPVWCRLGLGPRFNKVLFNQLREGMTEAEVEAILGPPGQHRSYGWEAYPFTSVTGFPVKQSGLSYDELKELRYQTTPNGRRKVVDRGWWGHTFFITVSFDENGVAVARHFGKVCPPRHRSARQRIMEWLMP